MILLMKNGLVLEYKDFYYFKDYFYYELIFKKDFYFYYRDF